LTARFWPDDHGARDRYVVAYGPMILGVVYVIRGISVIARVK
jgi:hypothetical protein